MLGKLMKYDMKYMARILPWLYLGAFCLSLLCSVFFLFMPEGLLLEIGTMIITYVGTLFVETLVIMTVVFLIMRIYRSMFSDEGYLTFTLPVKNSTVINSKILTGAIWTTFTVIVACIVSAMPSFAMSLRYAGTDVYDEIIDFSEELNRYFGFNDLIMFALIIIDVVVICFLIPSLYTFCASVVHKAKRARAFASIGMFVGILYGIVVFLVAVFVIIAIISESYMLSYGSYEQLSGFMQNMYIIVPLIILVITAPLTIFSWLMARRIADKKLNML